MKNNVDIRTRIELKRIENNLPPLYSDFREKAEKMLKEQTNNYFDKQNTSSLTEEEQSKMKSLFCLFNNSLGSKEVESYDGNKNNDCSPAVKEDCLPVVKDSSFLSVVKEDSSSVVKDSSPSVVSYDLDNDKFFVEETSVLKKDFNRKDLQNANILKLMRATDKDRNEIISILQKSSVNGQLDEEEFEYRTGLVLESKTLKQLEIITQDLLTKPKIEAKPAANKVETKEKVQPARKPPYNVPSASGLSGGIDLSTYMAVMGIMVLIMGLIMQTSIGAPITELAENIVNMLQ